MRNATEMMTATNTKIAVIAVVVCLATACSSTPLSRGAGGSPGDAEQDAAPVLTPAELTQLAALPNPAVERLPLSRFGNRPTYIVWGKQYEVMQSVEPYAEEGFASWYGTKFHQRRTSSGEPFDMYALTAAHRSLPIPAYARVTNLENGLETIVKVNDRGPFHEDRLIDLSFAAAVKLGFHEQGTARVRVETITVPADEPQPIFVIEAGQFERLNQAEAVQLQVAALTDTLVQIVSADNNSFRLRLGPIEKATEVERLRALLQAIDLGLPALLTIE